MQVKFEFIFLFAAELRKKSSKVKKPSVKSLFGIFTFVFSNLFVYVAHCKNFFCL